MNETHTPQQEPDLKPIKQEPGIYENLKEFIKMFLAATVHSRHGFGFNLPMNEDGSSLKDQGLRGLGYRTNEEGELEKIPESELDEKNDMTQRLKK